MKFVLKFQGFANGNTMVPRDGPYLKSFDFEAAEGLGQAEFTGRAKTALKFNSPTEAWDFINRVPANRPIREDGMPNRPLTCSNWSVEHVFAQ